MKYIAVVFALFMSILMVSGQYFGSPYGLFGDFNNYRLNSLHNDLNGPASFAGSLRDPRQNRGPVVFPPSPADAPVESSGVIVGASGYGFVPPNQYRSITTPSRITQYNTIHYYPGIKYF